MTKKFIDLVQERVAKIAIGASTARNMGPPKTVSKARFFLKQLNLKKFSAVKNEAAFQKLLNESTDNLKKVLPIGARKWGSSRKFINIFLRDAFYNRYLHEFYKLSKLENWLELPLDSKTAKKLRAEEKNLASLPKWCSVISLTPRDSEKYQLSAIKNGHSKKMPRVHLDLVFWN